MALKDSWKDLVDGESEVEVKPINDIAKAVINIEESDDNNQIFANALIGSASGEVVSLKDVSPIEHNIKATISSKNLFVYPYGESTKTRGNIEFVALEDGRVTANGTATSGAYIYLITRDKPFSLKAGTYTFSVGNMADSQRDVCLRVWVSTNGTEKTEDIYSSKVMTFNSDVVLASALLSVNEGIKVDNLIFEPQIEIGATKTPYTPYIADIAAVKVRAQGKNLFDGVWEQGIISGKDGTNMKVEGYIRGKNYIPVVYGEKYVFSNSVDNKVNALVYEYTEDFTYNLTTNLNIAPNNAYTPSKPTTKYIRFRFNTKALALDAKAQLEIGESATNYEPYKEPIEYAQGEAIKSIYPTTTLSTDTEGAIVEVEYNRDLNKAFTEIVEAIISLGGNV